MLPRPVLILILLVAAGCASQTLSASPSPSPTLTPTPSPTKSPLPSGWTTITRAADGFSISIPPTWRAIDLDPDTLTSAFKTLLEQNPTTFGQAYSLEQLQAMSQQGLKVLAFDFGPPSRGVLTNLNVLRQTLPSEMTAAVLSQLAASQAEVQFKTGTPKVEPAIVGNLDARLITYDFPLQSANGTFNASFSQYIAVRGKELYVITFTTRSDDAPGYRSTFDQIAANFALLP